MKRLLDYDTLWAKIRLRPPHMWYTWKIIEPYAKKAKHRLEIGAGILPKLPIKGTYFLDTSESAIEKLERQGGKGIILSAEKSLPFKSKTFDLIGSFETLEHLVQPEETIREVARVLKDNGIFIFSVPLHRRYWSKWDEFAGHVQRFDPVELQKILWQEGFVVEHCYTMWHPTKSSFRMFQYAYWVCYPIMVHFPKFFYEFFFLLHARIMKNIIRIHRHATLHDIGSDSANVLAICAKQRK